MDPNKKVLITVLSIVLAMLVIACSCSSLIPGLPTPTVAPRPTRTPQLSSPTLDLAGATEGPRQAVSTDGYPSVGPDNAPVTIVEFGDYECPPCQTWFQQTYNLMMSAYPGQIRFVYRDMPLSDSHPEALPAAEAAQCAGEQGAFWKFHDALYSGQYSLGRVAYEQYASDLGLDTLAFKACLDDHRYQAGILADYDLAIRLGVTATPSFFINGRLLVGAVPFATFKSVIDEELAGKP